MMRILLKISMLVGLCSVVFGLASAAEHEAGETDPGNAYEIYEYGPGGVIYLDQGWDLDTTLWWYHVSQGTVFIPYPWFLALEQAKGQELFSAPGHLQSLGFLTSPQHDTYNPHGLPVGFSRQPLNMTQGPHSVWQGDWLGFACAACHTGEVDFRGHKIRIEGGAARHDIEVFQDRLGAALQATLGSAEKFKRFAGRLLRSGTVTDPADLRQRYEAYVKGAAAKRAFDESAQAMASEIPTRSGFGRLDAHERGVNLFLASPIGEPLNYVPTTAPVSFPAIWDTPYFDWVLYNASIRQPLTRNIVEALGVQAPIDHNTIFADGPIVHGVQVDNIVDGQLSVMDLTSPRWPEQIFGPINASRATRGQEIYDRLCAGCHQVIDPESHRPVGEASSGDNYELEIPTFALRVIGTDPRQATTFSRRTLNLTKIGGPPEISSYVAAQAVTGTIAHQWINESEDNAQRAAEINQGRENEFRSLEEYRARPLNGIWSTAPYLHNGSVPNLDLLLRPSERRPKTFYMGNWEFDPVNVGFEYSSPFAGGFLFDTRIPGNSNAGHDFGVHLNDQDRAALIEYLKTL